jgi:hypothetical protein
MECQTTWYHFLGIRNSYSHHHNDSDVNKLVVCCWTVWQFHRLISVWVRLDFALTWHKYAPNRHLRAEITLVD